MQVLTDLNRAALQGQSSLWAHGHSPPLLEVLCSVKIFDYGVKIGDTKLTNVLKAASIAARQAGRLPKAQMAMLNIQGKLQGTGVLVNGLHIPQELADDLLDAVSGLAARLQHTTSGAEAARATLHLLSCWTSMVHIPRAGTLLQLGAAYRTQRSLTGMIPRAQDIGRVKQIGGIPD